MRTQIQYECYDNAFLTIVNRPICQLSGLEYSHPLPPNKMIAALRKLATAHLSDNMCRLYAVGPNVFPFHAGRKLVGPALTVKVSPGDNLMVHKAIEIAQPGDVIAVDAGGINTQAIIAERNGVAGIVIYGAIRDADALAKSHFPIYASAITNRGPYENCPGEINVPIVIGDAVVNPGDLIIGDDDGIVVLPQHMAENTIRLASLQAKNEAELLKNIRKKPIDRSWVDQILVSQDCVISNVKKPK